MLHRLLMFAVSISFALPALAKTEIDEKYLPVGIALSKAQMLAGNFT
jgi:hypothetical protein